MCVTYNMCTGEEGSDNSNATSPTTSAPGGGGGGLQRSNSTVSNASTTSKIENIRNWSISTYKCTKQLLAEKLGKTTRTVDTG